MAFRTDQLKDRWLYCQQCGVDFLFTVSEQQNYLRRGFDPPLRCQECRKNRSRINQDASWDPKDRKRYHHHTDDY